MNLLDRVRAVFSTRAIEAIHPSADPPQSWFSGLGYSPSGITVTDQTALTNSVVFACIRVLAESIASLPLKLYKREGNRKELATDHKLYSVLHDLANPEMTSFELRETLMGHLCMRGNAYSEIEMNGRGDVLALWPLRPDRTQVKRHDDGEIWYHITLPTGGEVALPRYRVWHIRGMSSNGLVGMSPIEVARNSIGMALAAEQMGNTFYGNGAKPGGVLEHPGKLSEPAYKLLKKSWEERHQGLTNANRVAILEEGMKWHDVSMSMQDAQLIESRKYQTIEIARIFRVPLHMIGDLEHATFSNIEQQGLEFVIHTLRPWLVRWEQSISRDLIGPIERNALFAEFLVDGLLRGDTATRYAAYQTGRLNGWLNGNEIRAMENLNPMPGGEEYWQPANVMVVGQPVPEPDKEPTAPTPEPIPEPELEEEPNPTARSVDWKPAYAVLIRDVMGRILRREVQDLSVQFRKIGSEPIVNEWVDKFETDHRAFVERNLRPAIDAIALILGEEIDVAAMIQFATENRLKRMYLLDEEGMNGRVSETMLTIAVKNEVDRFAKMTKL